MKRFIEPHELARDRRFIRQDNVMVNVLSTLPDEGSVEAFRKVTRERGAQLTLSPYAKAFVPL